MLGLGFSTTAVIKTPGQRQLKGEGVYLTPNHREVTASGPE